MVKKIGDAETQAAARIARQAANRAAREERRAGRQAERAQRQAERATRKDAAPKPDDKPGGDKKAKDKNTGDKKAGDTQAGDTQDRAEAKPASLPPAAPPLAAAPTPRQPAVASAVPTPPQLFPTQSFNILLIGQGQRLGVEAVLFAASLRRNAPGWRGRLIVAEPRSEAAWAGQPTQMPAPVRAALLGFGADILPFTATRFGQSYPYGNKIEALTLLPADQPFVFFDSDTLITGPVDCVGFDFARPAASMRRSASWPEPPPYGPGYTQIWQALYDRFGLDFASSLDLSQPDEHWERYLYFNAGWFFGANAQEFGRRFLDLAGQIQTDPGEALACQSLDPWLDQVALPLVIHSLGGGRPGAELAGLDGWASCHYRNLSLLYAREPDAVLDLIEELAADPRIAPLLAEDEAAQRLIVGGEGRSAIRPLFAGDDPPLNEKALRQRLRRAELWFR